MLAAVWLAWGTHPRIEPTGATWADPRFVEDPDVSGVTDGLPEPGETWAVQDAVRGADVAVELRNGQHYAVSVTPGDLGPGVVVRVALLTRQAGWDVAHLAWGDRIVVGPGATFGVLVHLSDECVRLQAGASVGTDRAPLDISGLGLHSTIQVPLPATYVVGRTTDHLPARSCWTGAQGEGTP